MKVTKSLLKQIIREEIEQTLVKKKTPFRRFLELALDAMFVNGIQDQMAQDMLELENEGKMSFEEIFNIWDDVAMLELFSQSDIENMAQQAGLPQQDIDYIMDLKQVRDLEQG